MKINMIKLTADQRYLLKRNFLAHSKVFELVEVLGSGWACTTSELAYIDLTNLSHSVKHINCHALPMGFFVGSMSVPELIDGKPVGTYYWGFFKHG